ncbi:MAG: hypothetical protein AB1625_01690 [Acidobacteriota bacterium]
MPAAIPILRLTDTAGIEEDSASRTPVPVRGRSALRHVGLSPGDRRTIEQADDPEVMSLAQAAVSADGEVTFTTTDPAQGHAIFADSPSTGSASGISGPVDVSGEVVRGAGPAHEPGISGMVLSHSGSRYVPRLALGPMSVGLTTGDRGVVSRQAEPAVGRSRPPPADRSRRRRRRLS